MVEILTFKQGGRVIYLSQFLGVLAGIFIIILRETRGVKSTYELGLWFSGITRVLHTRSPGFDSPQVQFFSSTLFLTKFRLLHILFSFCPQKK